MDASSGLNDPTCAEMKSARLLAFQGTGSGFTIGEYIGTSNWMDTTPGSCAFTFTQAYVTKARRGFVGNSTYVVEFSDVVNGTLDGQAVPAGCRVRSDLLGLAAAASSGAIGC